MHMFLYIYRKMYCTCWWGESPNAHSLDDSDGDLWCPQVYLQLPPHQQAHHGREAVGRLDYLRGLLLNQEAPGRREGGGRRGGEGGEGGSGFMNC